MHVPVPRPDALDIVDSSRTNDFAALAQALAERGGLALVYAPSTTTINNAAPVASPTPVEVHMTGPAVPLAATQTAARPGFTLGDVIAYSGATLMGGAAFSGLVSALLRVPELVPLLSGIIALVGMLAAIGGAVLDDRERSCC